MRQFLAVAAIAAIAAAQAGEEALPGQPTNDDRPFEISGDWQEGGPDNANRDMYKVAKDDDWTFEDEDALNESIWGVNGEGEEPANDGESRPLCTIAGFENKVDNQGPSDQCCRIYESSARTGNFRDFCIQSEIKRYDPNNPSAVINEFEERLTRLIQLDDYGWHNEMTSW